MKEEGIFGNDDIFFSAMTDDNADVENDEHPPPVTAVSHDDHMFDEMARVVTVRRSEGGESSSAVSAVAATSESAAAEESWDSSHKRAKFYTDFDECHFAAPTSSTTGKYNASADYGNYNYIQGSSLQPNNSTSYDAFSLMCTGEESHFDSSGVEDGEGNDSDISKVEDLEVRMDLTDDLLHMWRAASAHEDFWRSLNFEDRNISLEQFEDMCRRYPNATAMSISGPAIYLFVMKAISSLRNLEVLTLGRGQIADTFFLALPDCSMLKKLNINDATLGNGIQEDICYS
ncbi:Leucine-rich repeat domain superfamily [Sesbania bispinosa]|nr:Leucine-rich repeat domain superfamily [Sesbania bispinosa]